jgi:excisionase family DNA binding protein
MLTVPQAARRIGRNPETVRRWIREGKLVAQKVGTLVAQKVGTHRFIDEDALAVFEPRSDQAAVPDAWLQTITGEAMPDVVAAIHRSRKDH